MEIERILLVDPRETYVSPITIMALTLTKTSYSNSWIGEKYSSVRAITSISFAVLKLSDIFNHYSSAIIQDIEDMCAAGLASMAYYYFDFRDVKKQNIHGLLSSLLSQLSAQLDSCHDLLARSHSVNAGGTRKPTTIALTGYMKDILSLPGQGPIYLVIDALDECPNVSGTPSAREEVLELIEELIDLNLSNVYLCVTSRPEIDIRMVLDPLTPVQISIHDECGQKRDMIEYIRSMVHSDRRMRRWRAEDQNLVIDTLSEKADGM